MRALRHYRVSIALVGLLVVVGMLVAYRLKEQQARALPRARGDALVGVAKPERRDLEVKVASTADILPSKQAAIFSKISGYIRRIHADRGDFAREGQLLVEIDDQEILIPTLYVILEERFPREVPAPEGALTPQGEIA